MVKNTIISHLPGERLPACSTFTSVGHNVLGAGDACGQLQGSDIVGDAQLDAFVDDGSAGKGHFNLLPTSPAIDAAENSACDTTDQIGHYRTRTCDIGAIEFKPSYSGATTQPVRPAGVR